MSKPVAVRHTACGQFFLQHHDSGPEATPFWITNLDRCDIHHICPGCGVELIAAHQAGELVPIGGPGSSKADPRGHIEIRDLPLKLATIGQLRPMLSPQIGAVLDSISSDLRQAAA